MNLFGFELEIDKRGIILLSCIVSAVIIILAAIFVVYPKYKYLKARTIKLKKVSAKLKTEDRLYKKESFLLARLKRVYKSQQENLKKLESRFQNKGLHEEADLKIAMQNMINFLDIKMIELGASEVIEEKSYYIKEVFPYKLKGEFYKIGRLLDYIENSKWLLTLRGSVLKMIAIKEGEKDEVEVTFKLGGYILKGDVK